MSSTLLADPEPLLTPVGRRERCAKSKISHGSCPRRTLPKGWLCIASGSAASAERGGDGWRLETPQPALYSRAGRTRWLSAEGGHERPYTTEVCNSE
eukprot:scaffold619_cov403-Prasinococcus_capsulatus_cf.AAC.16